MYTDSVAYRSPVRYLEVRHAWHRRILLLCAHQAALRSSQAMVVATERTPLINGLDDERIAEEQAKLESKDDPANLSTARVATILAANWVSLTSRYFRITHAETCLVAWSVSWGSRCTSRCMAKCWSFQLTALIHTRRLLLRRVRLPFD